MSVPANPYPTTPRVDAGPLPDVLRPPGFAGRIDCPQAWPGGAAAWRDLILDLEYGGMPPAPTGLRFEEHHRSVRHTWPGKPTCRGFRIHCDCDGTPFILGAKLMLPERRGGCPVIINGDACWPRRMEIIEAVLARGYGLMLFDRTEAARDINERACRAQRAGGLFAVHPGLAFGALSAWAWCYRRCVDLLHSLDGIDRQRIGVSGHSRGGKTCLLAGVTDERITLVNDNAGCAGGGALFRYVGDGGETVDIVNVFPDWFDARMRAYVGKEAELPFDQHCLLAAIAPRPLLLTYALDDRWSNPEGMVLAHGAASAAYRLFGAGDRIAFHLRPGLHSHDLVDWRVLLDFADLHWYGRSPDTVFNQHPYGHLPDRRG